MIGKDLSSLSVLYSKLVIGIIGTLVSCILFMYILIVLERNQNSRRAVLFLRARKGDDNDDGDGDEINFDAVGQDTYLEVDVDNGNRNDDNDRQDYIDYTNVNLSKQHTGRYASASCSSDINNDSTTADPSSKKNSSSTNAAASYVKLLPSQWIIIAIQVFVLTLLNYLLLVYIPGGSGLLACIAIISVWILILYNIIIDEIRFHQRYDRLCVLITCYLFIAAGLSLITYCQLGIEEGQVYKGPARIVAYDAKAYNNSDGQTLRSNIRVSWGGSWGCSDTYDINDTSIFCTADINGTLCQTSYSVAAIQKQYVTEAEDMDQYEKDYDTSEEQYEEELESEQKGFVGKIDYSKNTTQVEGEYLSGKDEEDVYIVDEEDDKNNSTNKEEDVDIAFKDTDEEIQIKKGTNGTKVQVGFENTNKTTVQTTETTLFDTKNATTNSNDDKKKKKKKKKNSTTATNSTNSNGNGNNRFLVSSIDAAIEKDEEDVKVSNATEPQVEKMIQQKGSDETEYYNELVDEVNDIELEDGDEMIQDETSVEQLQAKHDALVKQNKALQDENAALQEKLKAEQEATDTIDAEFEDMKDIDSGVFTDDYYDNTYWNTYDWDYLWGDFQCQDLFNYDLQGSSMKYNPDIPPASDDGNNNVDDHWPTINIYGKCNTCEAYILDYYATEHFNTIHQYQINAVLYAFIGICTMIVSALFSIQYKRRPKDENKLELLSSASENNQDNTKRGRNNSRNNHAGVIA